MGRADACQNGESSSGSRFTRSHLQAGPVWTVQDMFILVNEVAAVEVDCQDALSSYQKWKIIAENCTALEVVRNANQCRRKWESLVADYNAVKEWESTSRDKSYWSFECGKREEAGLPVDFDKDLYKAIDEFMKATEQANTESESDSDTEVAEEDVLTATPSVPSRSKPKRVVNRSTPHKNRTVGRKPITVKEECEKPLRTVGRKPITMKEECEKPVRTVGRKPITMKEECEKPVRTVKDVEPIIATKLTIDVKTGPKPKRAKLESTLQQSETNERKQVPLEDDKPVPVVQDVEQILATKVMENTELVHAILAGVDDNHTVNEEIPDVKDDETAKRKAEKLIACLADLGKNLEQLCDVVKEC